MSEIVELNSDDGDPQEAYFSTVRQEHHFLSEWSMYDITDLDTTVPFSVSSLTYSGFTVIFPVRYQNSNASGDPMSWLDLWRAADFLLQASGTLGPVFIEEFLELENGMFELVTGS